MDDRTTRVQKGMAQLGYDQDGKIQENADRGARRKELKQRLEVLTGTDMAVIVLPGQNEIQQMQKLGLDSRVRH